jgi:SAM-dependent methyltransferase
MAEYDGSTYGDRWADVYDQWTARFGHVADAVVAAERLAELAGRGPALELAIGTGRVALPLAARGVEVHGIDRSEPMVTKLRAKPGGDAIPVTVGDMADLAVAGTYSLIYVVFNTFFALTSQDEQVRCFRNVAAHLTEDGIFVIEAVVPNPARDDRPVLSGNDVDADSVSFQVSMRDPVEQRVRSMIVVIDGGGIRLLPEQGRYVWPSELDLMAQLAGLRLRERWGGWNREPFTAASGAHVSLYERPTEG